MKPTAFNHQHYTDLEADYMILKAENETLKRLLTNMQEECDITDAANTALHGALEEAERRDKGCEYCTDHEDLAFGHDSMKRVGCIYIDKNLLVADLYSESMAVVICFCPVCGKRLEVEHGN